MHICVQSNFQNVLLRENSGSKNAQKYVILKALMTLKGSRKAANEEQEQEENKHPVH